MTDETGFSDKIDFSIPRKESYLWPFTMHDLEEDTDAGTGGDTTLQGDRQKGEFLLEMVRMLGMRKNGMETHD